MNRAKSFFISFLLYSIVFSGDAGALHSYTVCPNCDFPTIEAALAALIPFSDDIALKVILPEDGLNTPMSVDASVGFNGYTLSIQGVRYKEKKVTYYIGEEVEFNIDENQNTETTEYISAGTSLSRRVTDYTGNSGGNEYYIKNHLGSTMMMVDNDGDEVAAVYDYFSYGKKVTEYMVGGVKNETKTFTGKELDRYDPDMQPGEDGEGWYYFGARYYDPDICMWTAVDPARQFWSPYCYAGDNPIVLVDPNGEEATIGDWATILNAPVSAISAKVHSYFATYNMRRLMRGNEGISFQDAYKQGVAGNKYDAYRHAYWAISLTRGLGSDRAMQILAGHEIGALSKGLQTMGDLLMDVHNNLAGMKAALDPNNKNIRSCLINTDRAEMGGNGAAARREEGRILHVFNRRTTRQASRCYVYTRWDGSIYETASNNSLLCRKVV